MRLGTSNISALTLGSERVKKAYLGSVQVYNADVIDEYAIHRYRFDQVIQQDGTTPAAIGDPVYEFVDIARFGMHNLVWAGAGTPPVRTSTHVEIGIADDILWEQFLNAPIAQPFTLFLVMENLAGGDFSIFLSMEHLFVLPLFNSLWVDAGGAAEFIGDIPPDGVTSILQINLDGSNSELYVNNVPSALNPRNAGLLETSIIRIGTFGDGANWRFKEMFFTPLLDPVKATEIFNALNAVY